MKLDWMGKTILTLAPVYPAALLAARHSDWVAGLTLVLVDVAVVGLLVVALAKGLHKDSPSAIVALCLVDCGDQFLDGLVNNFGTLFTTFFGVAVSILLVTLVVSLWREKRKKTDVGGPI